MALPFAAYGVAADVSSGGVRVNGRNERIMRNVHAWESISARGRAVFRSRLWSGHWNSGLDRREPWRGMGWSGDLCVRQFGSGRDAGFSQPGGVEERRLFCTWPRVRPLQYRQPRAKHLNIDRTRHKSPLSCQSMVTIALRRSVLVMIPSRP